MRRLDHINIRTRDPAKMREFLSSLLGVKEGFRPPFSIKGHWLYFDGQDHAAIHMDHVEEATPLGIINHAAFAFFDLNETAAAVEATGYPFQKAEIPGTGIVQFFVTGPEGIRIEIQCRRE